MQHTRLLEQNLSFGFNFNTITQNFIQAFLFFSKHKVNKVFFLNLKNAFLFLEISIFKVPIKINWKVFVNRLKLLVD